MSYAFIIYFPYPLCFHSLFIPPAFLIYLRRNLSSDEIFLNPKNAPECSGDGMFWAAAQDRIFWNLSESHGMIRQHAQSQKATEPSGTWMELLRLNPRMTILNPLRLSRKPLGRSRRSKSQPWNLLECHRTSWKEASAAFAAAQSMHSHAQSMHSPCTVMHSPCTVHAQLCSVSAQSQQTLPELSRIP